MRRIITDEMVTQYRQLAENPSTFEVDKKILECIGLLKHVDDELRFRSICKSVVTLMMLAVPKDAHDKFLDEIAFTLNRFDLQCTLEKEGLLSTYGV